MKVINKDGFVYLVFDNPLKAWDMYNAMQSVYLTTKFTLVSFGQFENAIEIEVDK